MIDVPVKEGSQRWGNQVGLHRTTRGLARESWGREHAGAHEDRCLGSVPQNTDSGSHPELLVYTAR